MKKIFTIIAAVCIGFAAQSQIVTGIQGGYGSFKNSNTRNADFTTQSTILGGATLGYMITPKLMFAVSFSYNRVNDVDLTETDSIYREGMKHEVTNHQYKGNRSGWTLTPQVRYEVLRYGNMKFNLKLEGSYGKIGKSSTFESYNSWRNNHELINDPEIIGNNTVTMLDINLRPTLSYEFSEHLSAELSLDILSIGYSKITTTYDAVLAADNSTVITDSYSDIVSGIYGGINTFNEVLPWENGMIRLGMYYKF